MQISILSLMLAFGLPGANSCSAQQQGLPRVGQTAPVASQNQTPDVADSTDGVEDSDADDAKGDDAEPMEVEGSAMAESEEAPEAPESPEFEIAGLGGSDFVVEGTPPCDTHCESKCEAKCEGACESKSGGLGSSSDAFGSVQSGSTLDGRGIVYSTSQGGKVVHLKEKDLQGKGKTVTIEPGSTVILETKNGKQVVLRSESGSTLHTKPLAASGLLTLNGLFANAQATPQANQGDRVRELERRVRELEAQLRERDGQSKRSNDAFGWGGASSSEDRDLYEEKRTEERARASAERARAGQMRAQMSQQSRQIAEQARKQAEDMRKQAAELREQALEQAHVWHMQTPEPDGGWKVLVAPRAGKRTPTAPAVVAVPELPDAPSPASATPARPPEMAPMPGQPPAGAFWSTTPSPSAPRIARAARAPQAEHAQEMHAMLEEMKAQMQEMREQMQALRDELQNAPKREMR
jgi:hypothetical protein